MKSTLTCFAFLSSLFCAGSVFSQCKPVPSCSSLGYNATSCPSGESVLKCPFDSSQLYCVEEKDCSKFPYSDENIENCRKTESCTKGGKTTYACTETDRLHSIDNGKVIRRKFNVGDIVYDGTYTPKGATYTIDVGCPQGIVFYDDGSVTKIFGWQEEYSFACQGTRYALYRNQIKTYKRDMTCDVIAYSIIPSSPFDNRDSWRLPTNDEIRLIAQNYGKIAVQMNLHTCALSSDTAAGYWTSDSDYSYCKINYPGPNAATATASCGSGDAESKHYARNVLEF